MKFLVHGIRIRGRKPPILYVYVDLSLPDRGDGDGTSNTTNQEAMYNPQVETENSHLFQTLRMVLVTIIPSLFLRRSNNNNKNKKNLESLSELMMMKFMFSH